MVVGVWTMALALAGMPPAGPTDENPPSSATRAFHAVADAEWAWRQGQMADDEDSGDGISGRLPDVGAAAQAARLARWTEVLAQLDRIDPAALSPEDRINFAVYRNQIATLLTDQRFRDYQRPLSADTSFWGDVAGVARRPMRSEGDYRRYLSMLAQVPRYFDQQIANMKAGAARGFTLPRVTLNGRDASIRPIVDAGAPDRNPFYAPFGTMPDAIPAATRQALREKAKTVIGGAVVPAYAKLLAFLRDDYIPHATTAIDAYSLPEGHAYYQAKLREFTTLDLSPEQVHATGLKEVASIRSEMLAVMKEVRFQGDLSAFLDQLRTDPRFYAKTPDELLKDAAFIAKRFDGKASTWFGRLPRARFAIVPVPAEIAPFFTGGRGGPGVYMVNTYNLPARPLYSLTALTLHESAPGHAFQMPLAAENADLPAFRRTSYLSAYGEGWALYCEKLGVEMGMYDTPYDRFGMLSYQMWRAARLVVDTGIHAMGWSREQAQRYLHDNTALATHEIETEVDRYIAWPGQAVSYYVGERFLLDQRARAERALGPRFNIRAFHDAVLQLGSVPLPVVATRIDRFIAEGGKGPYPDVE